MANYIAVTWEMKIADYILYWGSLIIVNLKKMKKKLNNYTSLYRTTWAKEIEEFL